MSPSTELSEAAVAVVQCGLEDWVSLADLAAICAFGDGGAAGCDAEPGPERTRRAKVIEQVLRELVAAGLVRIGGLTASGFSAFDVDPQRSIHIVLGEFCSRAPAWPFNAWLDNTAAGDEVARERPRAPYHQRQA